LVAAALPGSSSSALGGELVGRGGDEPVEELLDLRRRDGAGELGDDLAVSKRLHGRNAADLKARREVRIAVGVHLDQLGLAGPLVDGGLERGAEHAAGTAPLGPEVHDHGDFLRALDHARLEIALIDVDGHASSLAARAPRLRVLTAE
jgi:hypothetical protein